MCCFKDCLGRYLAQDVFAKDPLPPFPASIKDGYAVIASDGASTRRVIGELSAGSLIVEKLMAGNCMRINTGAPIPEGADSVVQVEDTVLLRETDDGKTELEIDILKAPSLGQDIRLLGSDISQGEKLLSKGQQLGPTELGLLATTGVLQVPCYKLPTVGVLSTGNELLELTEPLSGGKIRDSNRTLLLTQLRDWGFPAVDMGIVEDSPTAVFKKLSKFLQSVDVIITTGGVSMGDKDYLKQVLEVDLKATIHFGRVFMKPGKPTTFATFNSLQGQKLLFCLPGNPVSAIVTCNLYVISALKKMAGCPNPERTVIRAKISEDLKLDPRPEYCRVVLTWTKDSDLPLASRTGNQISSRLLSMKSANGLLVLPPKSDQRSAVAKGDVFDAIVIGRL